MDRRALIAGASALLASPALAEPFGAIPPLKSLSSSPLGVSVRAAQTDEPAWANPATTHFSRLTAEWEMKMEYVLLPNGGLRLDRADQIVAFARRNNMQVHGHTLIWYAQDGDYFQKLQGNRDAFLTAYADYIRAVLKRYRGSIGSWDVVNEPITDEGNALRPCLWRKVLGDDYIGLALTAAHEADPAATLFLNDYNLEMTPAKRRTFLKLCESLLKSGAPLHGIGTQTHIPADITPGLLTTAIRDIASLGLKVHVSEIDISTVNNRPGNMAQPRIDQIRALRELVDVYEKLPASQRYGLTFWGLRDSDSWLNSPKEANGRDEPLLFDKLGRPKPVAAAFADALK